MKKSILAFAALALCSTVMFGQRPKKKMLTYTYIQSPLIKFDEGSKYFTKVIQVNKDELLEKRNAFDEKQRMYDETFEKELEAYNNSSVAGRVLLKKPKRKVAIADFMGAVLNEEILANSAIDIQGLQRASSEGDIQIEIKLEGFSIISNEKVVDEKKNRKYYKTTYRNPYTVSIYKNSTEQLFSKSLGNDLKEAWFLERDFDKSTYEMEKEWKENKVSLLSGLEDETIKNDLAEANTLLNDQIGYPQKTMEIKFYTAAGKKFDYSQPDHAIDLLKEAFLLRLSDPEVSNEKLTEAIAIWQTELETKDIKNKKARVNKKITTGFYLDMAYAHTILKNFTEARKYYLEAEKLRTMWIGPEIDLVRDYITESKKRN